MNTDIVGKEPFVPFGLSPGCLLENHGQKTTEIPVARKYFLWDIVKPPDYPLFRFGDKTILLLNHRLLSCLCFVS